MVQHQLCCCSVRHVDLTLHRVTLSCHLLTCVCVCVCEQVFVTSSQPDDDDSSFDRQVNTHTHTRLHTDTCVQTAGSLQVASFSKLTVSVDFVEE